MSTDWNIRCVECDDVHQFSDANHQEAMMLKLIRHRDAIAALAPLFSEPHTRDDITFRLYYGHIDPVWFAKHAGHKLVPHDEYGRDLNQCQDRVRCDAGHSHDCTLPDGHDGPHRHVTPTKETP